jgi:homospermidine synthase
MIHVNDIDLQQIKTPPDNEISSNILYNTWCIDTFLFELLTEATFSIGTHENDEFNDEYKHIDLERGFVELNMLSADRKARTYYPGGAFEGFLVTHEETATIAKSLEVSHDGKGIYRPTVMFIYAPCLSAEKYLEEAKVNNYPNPDSDKPLDCINENNETIIRGYRYPQRAEIAYGDKISSGTEYVGVLLIGDNFQPVWVGNRVELPFLYKDKKTTYWQTPTITPVAISALAAICWMITHKDKKGIFFPEDITDYKYILKIAEKYISKTIYKTFSKEALGIALKTDLSKVRAKDFLVC